MKWAIYWRGLWLSAVQQNEEGVLALWSDDVGEAWGFVERGEAEAVVRAVGWKDVQVVLIGCGGAPSVEPRAS